MQIKISLKNNELEIGFFDKGKAVVPGNVQHRKLDDIKPGGLGTFYKANYGCSSSQERSKRMGKPSSFDKK